MSEKEPHDDPLAWARKHLPGWAWWVIGGVVAVAFCAWVAALIYMVGLIVGALRSSS